MVGGERALSSTPERVLIVGAGIGGLAAGAALGQAGIDVEIIEINATSNVYGVGINQPANSLRALKRLGVLEQVLAVGFEFDRYEFRDYRGELIVSVPSLIGGSGDVPANVGLTRRELHDILIGAADRAGASVAYGTQVAELHDGGDSVHVTRSDGVERDYDLVVAFDGINSPMRRRLFGGEITPVYTGYGVWRITVPRPPEVTGCALFQGPNAKAGYIPLSDQLMYLLHVTPEPAHVHYDERAFPQMLRERLEGFGGIPGEVRDAITDEDVIVYSPLSEVMLPAPWHRGRVLIAGDAAHACTPHITQGAAMAIEDAVVLADELTREPGRALAASLEAFNARRHPRARFVQDVSRGILNAEMSITDLDTLAVAAEHMAAELPAQMAQVDAFLAQPA
jgi:2-polyprenyl-6-methoxyphenol hydroxylase-like FAD-dependent oxidoreductase